MEPDRREVRPSSGPLTGTTLSPHPAIVPTAERSIECSDPVAERAGLQRKCCRSDSKLRRLSLSHGVLAVVYSGALLRKASPRPFFMML